uniref:NR LBD domain-containing protein n=2 Tax=Caenorhabditis tropicalis TaxID=1561998 RepID=A0A1I7URU2_9PELO
MSSSHQKCVFPFVFSRNSTDSALFIKRSISLESTKMTMMMNNQISSAVKFEFIKHKFVSLRDNLKFLLDVLNQMGTHPEAKIDSYHVMKIKTNLFIDEIDYHLQGDVTYEQLKEYFVVYSKFYHRSRTELSEVLHEINPSYQFVW